MGLTPTYLLPYPEATDPADVPVDMRELAERIEDRFVPGTVDGYAPVWDNTAKKWSPQQRDVVALADVTLGANAATLAFANIPQTFKHLQVVLTGRSSAASLWSDFVMWLNADQNTWYEYEYLDVVATTPSSNAAFGATYGQIGLINGGQADATAYSTAEVLLPHYTDTALMQHWHAFTGAVASASGGGQRFRVVTGRWRGIAGITRVEFYPLGGSQMVAGSKATLYGLKG